MAIINLKKSLPRIGDCVDKIITSKDKRYAQITFDSGSQVVIVINPAEYGKIKDSAVPKRHAMAPASGVSEKKVVSKPVNEMVKNSPEDEGYKRRALAAIAKLDGKTPEEVQELLENNAPRLTGTIGQPTVEADNDWKEKAASALDKSQERATKLANEYARSHGAKTEASFGGKSTIELK